jgi:hypothetical protein
MINIALNPAKQIRRALNPADFYLSALSRALATQPGIFKHPAARRPLPLPER